MSYKRFRDDIPKDIVDEIYNRRDSELRYIYRAVRTIDTKDPADFVPTFISNQYDNTYVPSLLFGGPKNIGECSMSVYEDLEILKKVVASSKNVLLKQTKGYAFGPTNSNRGIWSSPNSRTHIDYFLFDWESNNPCEDFDMVEKDENR